MEKHEKHEIAETPERETTETPVKEVYQKPLLVKHEAFRDLTGRAAASF